MSNSEVANIILNNLSSDDFKNVAKLKFDQIDRLNVIYGSVVPPLFPCGKCGSEECEGKKECKGFGSYRLEIKIY